MINLQVGVIYHQLQFQKLYFEAVQLEDKDSCHEMNKSNFQVNTSRGQPLIWIIDCNPFHGQKEHEGHTNFA